MTANWMSEKVNALTQGLDSPELVESLPEIHSSAAGLKALCTLLTHAGLEDLRKCLGGNGYLMNSGLAKMATDYAWQVTAEGDVIILLLQCARFLVKSLEKAKKGESLPGLVKALEPLRDPSFAVSSLAPKKATSSQDFLNLEFLESLFRYRAVSAIVNCGNELNEKMQKQGMSYDQAWNATALNLTNTAKSHCLYFMLVQMNAQVQAGMNKDAAMGRVLHELAALFACSEILDGNQWLGVLDTTEAVFLQQAINSLLDSLRPNLIALVNAFDIPDRVLNSTVGRKDGNVYEALYEAAKDSTLNRTEVLPGWDEIVKPHLDLELLENQNKSPLLEVYFDEEECELVESTLSVPSKL